MKWTSSYWQRKHILSVYITTWRKREKVKIQLKITRFRLVIYNLLRVYIVWSIYCLWVYRCSAIYIGFLTMWPQWSQWNWCIIVFFPSDLFLFSNQFGRSIDVLFFRQWSRESFNCHDAVPYTTKTIASKVHWEDHFYLVPFTGRSSIYCFG